MTLNEFYVLPENLPFSVSITVVMILSLLEGVLLFFGVGLINFIDSLFPDLDFDIEGFGVDDPGVVSKTLSFLRIKEVPLIILLVAFLMSYGVSGLIIQSLSLKYLGQTMSAFLISIPSILIGFTLMKGFGEVLSKIMPSDETDAKEISEYTNKIGFIVLGTAKMGAPAQCKVKDKNGQIHYFMVLPDHDEEIEQGEKVLLVRYEAPYFYVIKPKNKNI